MSPLKRWRGSRTLEDVAHEVGTTAATLSRLERGVHWPQESLVRRIIEVSGLTAEMILQPVLQERAAEQPAA